VRSRRAVEVAERYAEGRASLGELATAAEAASSAAEELLAAGGESTRPVESSARCMCWYAADNDQEIASNAGLCLRSAVTVVARAGPTTAERERQHQCGLIRDLFGNPFRLVRADPAWLSRNDAIVVRMAQAMTRSGEFADIPILADALEEAGCDDANILDHCRGPAEHARGCWVLDLLAGNFPGGVTCEESLEENIAAFVRAFEAVFDRDWTYTCESMGIDRRGDGTTTFLNTGLTAAQEAEDWACRGWLLRSYRELKRVMEARGIGSNPGAESDGR